MEIIYLMYTENKSLAWTVGDEQASPSLDLVTTNLASSVLRYREGGASMDCTARLGCKPMHLRRRDIHGLHGKAWMQTNAPVEERCKQRHDMKVGCEEQGGGEAGRQGEEGQGREGPQQAQEGAQHLLRLHGRVPRGVQAEEPQEQIRRRRKAPYVAKANKLKDEYNKAIAAYNKGEVEIRRPL